jgi:Flp pilus assembly protein TadG
MIQRLRLRRRTRGAAMVEMAMVLPILLALTFGAIEYGWLFFKVAQINLAARQGVRTAVRPAADTTEVNTAIADVMNGAGMGSASYTVTVTDLGVAVGQPVTVQIDVDYSTVRLTGFVPGPSQLHGLATMAKEGPPPSS